MTSLPVSRKIVAGAMMELRNLRIDDNTLDVAMQTIQMLLDPSNGQVKVGETIVLVGEIRKRLQMLPLPELIMKLATQLFFKLDDNFEYDLTPEEVDRRVELFKGVKKKVILSGPILDLIGQTALFQADSETQESFLREMEMTQVIADVQKRHFFKSSTSPEN